MADTYYDDNPWQRSSDPLDPLNEGYPPPQPWGTSTSGSIPSEPMPSQPQMMPQMPGTGGSAPSMSSPAQMHPLQTAQQEELQRQLKIEQSQGAVHPSWWRTALAAAAQFGTRRNPALGETISNAILSSDPNVRAEQIRRRNLQLQKEAADVERGQNQVQRMADYNAIIGGVKQTQAAAIDQNRKLAENEKLYRAGAQPLPTIPAAPLPPSMPAPPAGTTPQQQDLPAKWGGPLPPAPTVPPAPLPGGLTPEISSALNAAPAPPPQPVRFANAMPAVDALTGERLQIPSKADQETERLRVAQQVQQAGWKELPDEVADYNGVPRGTKLPLNDWTKMVGAYNKPDPAQSSAAAKQTNIATMAKLASAGLIDQGSLSDPTKQWDALDAGVKRGVITAQEAAASKSYALNNPMPAQTEMAAIARMLALNAGRPVQVLGDNGIVKYDTAGNAIRTGTPAAATIPGSTRATRQFAETVTNQTPVVTKEVQELKDELGPMAGRWNDLWVNRAGMNDPKFAGLDQDLNMYATALVRVHYGMTGGEKVREDLMKNFHEAQSPENLIARIQHADEWVKGYATMGNPPSAGRTTPTGGNKKIATSSDVQAYADTYHVSPNVATKHFTDSGYEITK